VESPGLISNCQRLKNNKKVPTFIIAVTLPLKRTEREQDHTAKIVLSPLTFPYVLEPGKAHHPPNLKSGAGTTQSHKIQNGQANTNGGFCLPQPKLTLADDAQHLNKSLVAPPIPKHLLHSKAMLACNFTSLQADFRECKLFQMQRRILQYSCAIVGLLAECL
jgi:hypothetical protein